jgi:protein ImuB
LAALPQRALIARIGQAGYRIQALARGEYQHLLVPTQPSPDAVLSESTALEHPVDLLEPLLFLLGRMLEHIIARAAESALDIACVETSLVLAGAPRREHRRVVRPALPEHDHHTLLKLIQLDLEMHPPGAAVIALHLQAQPARPQTVQQGLFVPQTPEAGRLEVLLARLRKLLGEDRIGVPELLDSHCPDAFRMAPFIPRTDALPPACVNGNRASALRMLRPPRVVRVEMQNSRIVTLGLDGRKPPVFRVSGPWKTSGAWWTHSEWCREEWDVALGEQESLCCRVAYDPGARCWYLTGIYD